MGMEFLSEEEQYAEVLNNEEIVRIRDPILYANKKNTGMNDTKCF